MNKISNLNINSKFKILNSKFFTNKGQTLIEIIITIAIIVTAIIGVLGLVTQSMIAGSSSKLKTQAAFLAQESIEIVHNIRDTNWAKELYPWDKNFYTSDGWYTLNNYDSTNGWTLTFAGASETTDGTDPAKLKLNNIQFIRYIKIAKYNNEADKREVTVKVTWVENGKANKVEFSSVLTDYALGDGGEGGGSGSNGVFTSCDIPDLAHLPSGSNSPSGSGINRSVDTTGFNTPPDYIIAKFGSGDNNSYGLAYFNPVANNYFKFKMKPYTTYTLKFCVRKNDPSFKVMLHSNTNTVSFPDSKANTAIWSESVPTYTGTDDWAGYSVEIPPLSEYELNSYPWFVIEHGYNAPPTLWIKYLQMIEKPIDANAWIVGATGTVLKFNGFSWDSKTSGTTTNLLRTSFVNNTTGWTAGPGGTVLKTTNGGESWVSKATGTTTNLRDIYFIDSNTGWIVGNSGLIRKSTNGGESWTAKTSGTTATLLSVYFIDNNTGWITGAGGRILKTTNGGETWIAKTTGTTNDLWSVRFINGNVGIAVGASGTVLKTTDGGESWTVKGSMTTVTLYDVKYANSNIVVAVGDTGVITRSDDTGERWTARSDLTTNLLFNLYFANSNVGWIVGYSGTILKTPDGGLTWIQESSPTSVNLYGVRGI